MSPSSLYGFSWIKVEILLIQTPINFTMFEKFKREVETNFRVRNILSLSDQQILGLTGIKLMLYQLSNLQVLCVLYCALSSRIYESIRVRRGTDCAKGDWKRVELWEGYWDGYVLKTIEVGISFVLYIEWIPIKQFHRRHGYSAA